MSSGECSICKQRLAGDYFHRGSCGHHECVVCALPKIRAGKMFCAGCPLPQRPTDTALGNLVLGSDGEQNLRVATQLKAERLKLGA